MRHDARDTRATSLGQVRLMSETKLALRLWFSNREQTVWRTLEGLMKGHEAMNQLHKLSSDCIGGAARRPPSAPPFSDRELWAGRLGVIGLTHGARSVRGLRAILRAAQFAVEVRVARAGADLMRRRPKV